MGKRVVKIWDLPSSGTTAVLLILSVSFVVGSLAGCLLADQIGGSGSNALTDYLEGFLSAAYSGDAAKPEVVSLVWEIVRWPLIIFLLGLTPLGLLGVPISFIVRGFLLSFAVASFFRAMGAAGLGLAFIVFGISGLISVPTLFVLGVQSFLTAGAITGRLIGESRKTPLFDRVVLLRCGMCAAALCVCCFAEYNVIPVLLGSLAEILLG